MRRVRVTGRSHNTAQDCPPAVVSKSSGSSDLHKSRTSMSQKPRATGSNPGGARGGGSATYDFIRSPMIWGWASWVDRWTLHDRNLVAERSSGLAGKSAGGTPTNITHSTGTYVGFRTSDFQAPGTTNGLGLLLATMVCGLSPPKILFKYQFRCRRHPHSFVGRIKSESCCPRGDGQPGVNRAQR